MKNEQYNLDKKTLIGLFFDSVHLTMLHYGLWFREAEYQIGLDKAIMADDTVWKQILPTIIRRIAKRLGLPMKDNALELLTNLSKEDLVSLLQDMGKNWAACDGIWFQTIENNYDYEMYTAKRINDTNWVRFSYIEAKTIMKRLNLPENGGIAALKEALKYRQSALVNRQEIIELSDNKITFRMKDCRAQSARRRKDMPDYPCKSAGVVEFSRFAEAVDPRIKMKCISCPPDPHPDEWWCAWEFEIS
ncbi:DUF6125 family protein [Chloroflexota bacterium]